MKKSEQQAIIECVALHMMKQGAPAIGQHGGPVLHDRHGRCCAIGCLLDPKDPIQTIAGAVWRLKWGSADPRSHAMKFAGDLAYCHDNASGDDDFVGGFAQRLRRFCLEAGLRYPEEILG